MKQGSIIISLDFELNWGAAEKTDLNEKSQYFLNTRDSIPRVLKLFKENEIRATWGTVGFLFAKNKEQLKEFIPLYKPTYENAKLSYYSMIDDKIGNSEDDDPYHYANSLIQMIVDTPNQELASHTFCHYYCNEKGQSLEQFKADLKAAQKIAKINFDIELKSLIFPRNQFNTDYLEVAKDCGFKLVRSNPDVWFWQREFKFNYLFRAIDTLFPISKSLTFKKVGKEKEIIALPASRFLRPFVLKERFFQSMKMNRIKREMSFAAKKGRDYHLWWHPHNFGNNTEENEKYLLDIINHFNFLKEKYNFQSKCMLDFIE